MAMNAPRHGRARGGALAGRIAPIALVLAACSSPTSDPSLEVTAGDAAGADTLGDDIYEVSDTDSDSAQEDTHVPAQATDYGLPCTDDAACDVVCVPTTDAGGVCGGPCTSAGCPDGFACHPLPEGVLGEAGEYCLPDVGCGALDYQGECEGTVLSYCALSGPAHYDCANDGDACALVDPIVGYDCVSVDDGLVHVRGALSYTRTVQVIVDDDVPPEWERPQEERPIRAAHLEVYRSADDVLLVSGASAEDGTFDLAIPASEDAVYLVAVAGSDDPWLNIRVNSCPEEDCLSGGLYGVRLDPFATTEADLGAIVVDMDGVREAFHLFDLAVTGHEFMYTAGVTEPLPPLDIRWREGGESGCSNPAISCYKSDTLYVRYAWADSTIWHEYSHYLVDQLSDSDSPGGSHNGSRTDPRLAWAEGFATFSGCAIAGDPRYVSAREDGGWWYDVTVRGVRDDRLGLPDAPLDQDVSENMVSGFLWVLGHGLDTIDGVGDGPTWDIQQHYIAQPVMVDRGVAGIDLVDFLDGWRCRAHDPGTLTETLTRFAFPYDEGGPDDCL